MFSLGWVRSSKGGFSFAMFFVPRSTAVALTAHVSVGEGQRNLVVSGERAPDTAGLC